MRNVLLSLFLLVFSTRKGAVTSTDKTLNNSAFVFVKPHANTPAVQKVVREKLTEAGCKILSESDISGRRIDKEKLIDQHYFAIGK